jgi:hypothetical protein
MTSAHAPNAVIRPALKRTIQEWFVYAKDYEVVIAKKLLAYVEKETHKQLESSDTVGNPNSMFHSMDADDGLGKPGPALPIGNRRSSYGNIQPQSQRGGRPTTAAEAVGYTNSSPEHHVHDEEQTHNNISIMGNITGTISGTITGNCEIQQQPQQPQQAFKSPVCSPRESPPPTPPPQQEFTPVPPAMSRAEFERCYVSTRDQPRGNNNNNNNNNTAGNTPRKPGSRPASRRPSQTLLNQREKQQSTGFQQQQQQQKQQQQQQQQQPPTSRGRSNSKPQRPTTATSQGKNNRPPSSRVVPSEIPYAYENRTTMFHRVPPKGSACLMDDSFMTWRANRENVNCTVPDYEETKAVKKQKSKVNHQRPKTAVMHNLDDFINKKSTKEHGSRTQQPMKALPKKQHEESKQGAMQVPHEPELVDHQPAKDNEVEVTKYPDKKVITIEQPRYQARPPTASRVPPNVNMSYVL